MKGILAAIVCMSSTGATIMNAGRSVKKYKHCKNVPTDVIRMITSEYCNRKELTKNLPSRFSNCYLYDYLK